MVGPYEVLAWAARERDGFGSVFTVAKTLEPVRCAKGVRFLPGRTIADPPPLDIQIVPGGVGTTAAAANDAILRYVREQAAGCEWVTGVRTGVRVLLAAGPARDRRVTTHWGAVEEVRKGGSRRASSTTCASSGTGSS